MSDTFWKRLNNIFGLLAVAAIFGLAWFCSHLEIKDLDLWLHIGTGRYIVEHGFQVPQVDVFSCTIAGRPWNNHEWLFQLLVYYLHKFFGFEGIINMQVVVVLLTLGILFLIGYNPQKQLISIFTLLCVLLVYQTRFTNRPDLFSLFFFVLFIWILSYFLNRRWSVWVLCVIQVLWTNMHGFFFFGPLFVLIGLVAEWIKRHCPLPWEWNQTGRLEDDEYRRLKWILATVVLACFLNPQTIQGAIYPLKIFFQISGESKVFFENIVELKRPITLGTIFDFEDQAQYRVLILLSVISFFYNRLRIDIGAFLFWLVFLIFSLSAVRNLSYFAFAAYLVILTNAMTVTWRDIVPLRIRDKKFLYILGIVARIFITSWVIQRGVDLSYNGYYDLDTYERKSEYGGVSQRTYPFKAVDFLVANKVKGNFFNDFNSGAYLVGRCSPDIKVFIDGRTEVYGPRFFKKYKRVWGDGQGIAETLKHFEITGALLHSLRGPVPADTLKYFYNDKEWVPVYFNYDAVIFLKDIPLNQDVIQRFRIDWDKYEPPKAPLRKIGSKNVPVLDYVNRAFTLQTVGLYPQAIAELEEAKAINPAQGEVYKNLGKIYSEMKDYEKAFENFRISVIFSPNEESQRLNLALSYYDLGEYEYAANQYQKIIDMWPDHPRGYFMMARTRVQQRKYKEGIEALRQGFALDPRAVKEVIDIGDMIFDNGDYAAAKEAYAVGRKGTKRQDAVHLKLGLVHRALGDYQKAKEEFEAGLKVNANREDLKSNLEALLQERAGMPEKTDEKRRK